jgi:hypothetical protein
MWLTPFVGAGGECGDGGTWLTVDLGSPLPVRSIRLHNYNKSVDDTFRGVKRLRVWLDDVELSPAAGLLVRKAPGTDVFDFGQTLLLDCPPGVVGESVGEVAGASGGTVGTRAMREGVAMGESAAADGVSREMTETRTHDDGDVNAHSTEAEAVLAAFPAEVRAVYRAAQRRPNHNELVQQSFETPLLPVGGVLQVVIQVCM